MCSGNTWSTLSECQRYRYFKRRAFYWRLLMFGAIPTFSPSPLPFGTCCNTYLQHFRCTCIVRRWVQLGRLVCSCMYVYVACMSNKPTPNPPTTRHKQNDPTVHDFPASYPNSASKLTRQLSSLTPQSKPSSQDSLSSPSFSRPVHCLRPAPGAAGLESPPSCDCGEYGGNVGRVPLAKLGSLRPTATL